MTFFAYQGSFLSTTASTFDVTDCGFKPKALIFWTSNQTAYGDIAATEMGLGFGVEPLVSNSDRTFTQGVGNALSTSSNIHTTITGGALYLTTAGAGAQRIDMRLSTFPANGFRVQFISGSVANIIVHYLAIGGTDVEATAGLITPRTTTGTQAITGLPFAPKMVLLMYGNGQVAGASIGFGVATGPTARWAATWSASSSATMATAVDVIATGSPTKCIYLEALSGSPVAAQQADLQSMDANGFTLNYTQAAATPAWTLHYIALGGTATYGVGQFTKAANTTETQITVDAGLPIAPKAYVLWSNGQAVWNGALSWKNSLGMTDGVRQAGLTFEYKDSTNPTQARRYSNNNMLMFQRALPASTAAAGATEAVLTHNSFTPTGFVVNVPTNASAIGFRYPYFTFGPAIGPPGEIPGGGTAAGRATNTATISKATEPALALGGPADDFLTNNLNTGLWTFWGTGSGGVSSSAFNIYSDGVINHYSGLISNATYDVTDKAIQAHVAPGGLPNQAAGNQMYLQVELDGNNALTIGYENGNLFIQDKIAATITTRVSIPWASASGIRITFDNANGRVWFSSTTNGTTWTTRWGRSMPFATTAMKVVAGAGSYGQANYGVASWESIGYPVRTFKSLNRFIYGSSTATGVITKKATDIYGQTVQAHPNLIAYWRLDEASGTVAREDAKGLYPGVYAGAPTLGVPGTNPVSGSPKAASFNGTDQYVSIATNVPITGAFSVEAWVKPGAWPAAAQTTLINRMDVNGYGGFVLDVDNLGRFTFNIYEGAGLRSPGVDPQFMAEGWLNCSTTLALDPTLWHHVVCTYDGSGGYIVVDGGFDVAGNAAIGSMFEPTEPYLQIGRNIYWGTCWPGVIDEVAVYNTNLDMPTIEDHYAKGSAPVLPGRIFGASAAGAAVCSGTIEAVAPSYVNLAGGSAGKSTVGATVSVLLRGNLRVSTTYPPIGCAMTVGLIESSSQPIRPMLVRQVVNARANNTNVLSVSLDPVAPGAILFVTVHGGSIPGYPNVGTPTWNAPSFQLSGVAFATGTTRASVAVGTGGTLRSFMMRPSGNRHGGNARMVVVITGATSVGELSATVLEIHGARTQGIEFFGTQASHTAITAQSFAPNGAYTPTEDAGIFIAATSSVSTAVDSTFEQVGMPGQPWLRVAEETDGRYRIPYAVDVLVSQPAIALNPATEARWNIPASLRWGVNIDTVRGLTPGIKDLPFVTADGVTLAVGIVDKVPAAISTLTDDFNDEVRDTAKWNIGLLADTEWGGGSVSIVEGADGTLQITPSSNNYTGYVSVNHYNMTGGGEFTAKLLRGTDNVREYGALVVGSDNNNYAEINHVGNLTQVVYREAGGSPVYAVFEMPGMVEALGTWQWRRIKESSGGLVFSTSPDGYTWTDRYTYTTPTFDLSNVLVALQGGQWDGAGVHTVRFDDLNIIVVAPSYKNLTGASAGAATGVGQSTRRRSLIVAAAGVSVATATPTRRRRLAVAAAGTASVTALISRRRPLSVSAAGVATVAVQVGRKRQLVALSAGASTGAAQPTRRRPLLAVSAGVASVSVQIGRVRSLQLASAAGTSSATAQVTRRRSLVSLSVGQSVTTAVILRKRAILVTTIGIAGAVGQPSAKRVLTGASAGQTTVLGIVSEQAGAVDVIGSTAGRATVTATLLAKRRLSATSVGATAVVGQVTRRRVILAATSTGTSSVSVSLTTKQALTGASAGTSTEVGQSTARRALVVSSAGQATVSATTTRRRPLTASSVGTSSVTANLVKASGVLPTAAGLFASTTSPLVQFGSVAVTPAVAPVVTRTSGPILTSGSISMTPDVVGSVARSQAPGVVSGSLVLVSQPVAAVARTQPPLAISGSLGLQPVFAKLVPATQATPIQGSLAILVTPATGRASSTNTTRTDMVVSALVASTTSRSAGPVARADVLLLSLQAGVVATVQGPVVSGATVLLGGVRQVVSRSSASVSLPTYVMVQVATSRAMGQLPAVAGGVKYTPPAARVETDIISPDISSPLLVSAWVSFVAVAGALIDS